MKTFSLLVFLFVVMAPGAFATDYYFSNSGNDSNSGTTPESPLKSLARASTMRLAPGDRLLFKRGEVFRGTLLMFSSGTVADPITIGSYGDGNDAVIKGSEYINNWTPVGNGIYRAACAVYPQMVFYKGRTQILGRYPNEGFLFADAGNGNSGFTDNDLPNTGSLYTGAGVHIRTARYRYEERSVAAQSGKSLTFSQPAANPIVAGAGYYLTGKLEFVDAAGEYYYDDVNHQLYLKTENGLSPEENAVEASVYDDGIKVESSAEIVITNIVFNHQQRAGIYVYGVPNKDLAVTNCVFQNIYLYGITGSNKNTVLIENNQFYDIWNTAIYLGGVPNMSVKNNIFKRIGIAAPGRATDNLISYKCIDMNGSDGEISNNILDSIGNGGIQFFQNTLVENNIITRYCMTLDDGAGIGAWGQGNGIRNGTGCIIRNNFVSAPPGNTDSYPAGNEPMVTGMGMDDNSGNAIFENNTVFNIKGRGISIHNSSNNQIRNNTIFNCSNGALVFEHDNNGGMLTNNVATGNILYGFHKDEYVLKVVNWHQSETGLDFGTFSGNYYINPYFDAPIYTAQWGTDISGTYNIIQQEYSVKGWRDLKDAGAKETPARLQYFKVTDYVGSDLVTNGNFDANMNGWGCYAENFTCSSSWQNNSKLDGGSVKITSAQYDYGNFYNTTLFALQKGKKYLLTYSVVGDANKIAAFNIQDRSNWAQLTPVEKKEVATTRTEHQLLAVPNADTKSAQLTFYVGPQYITSYWLDNIKLQEVKTEDVDPEAQNLIFTNPTGSAKAVPLTGSYTDMSGNLVTGMVQLEPFSSKVLILSAERTLPLTLVDIKATAGKDMESRVEWTLASADGNCKMELQKSTDGKSFETVSSVDVEAGVLDYQYLDKNFLQTSFYRLKSRCAGEQVSYSKIVKAAKETGSIAVYPNPISGNQLNIVNNENYNLAAIFNSEGQKLMHAVIYAGKNILSLPRTMTTGIYLLRLSGRQQSQTIRLLKN